MCILDTLDRNVKITHGTDPDSLQGLCLTYPSALQDELQVSWTAPHSTRLPQWLETVFKVHTYQLISIYTLGDG